jgi:hydroxymethylglutaryl-CoA lyase
MERRGMKYEGTIGLARSYAVGLVTLEDMVVMMDEMGIELGIDVDRVLDIGRMMEKIVGRRLRSESILNGRVPKEPRPEFRRS